MFVIPVDAEPIGIGRRAQPFSVEFVPLFRTIAGLSLSSDITAYQLKQSLGLSAVASSGDYNDLLNKPSQTAPAWSDITGKPNMGDYQIKANMAQSISASGSGNTNLYASVSAQLAYFMPYSGGQFSAQVKAFNADTPTQSIIRNIRFVQGDGTELPSDMVNGELVFFYD